MTVRLNSYTQAITDGLSHTDALVQELRNLAQCLTLGTDLDRMSYLQARERSELMIVVEVCIPDTEFDAVDEFRSLFARLRGFHRRAMGLHDRIIFEALVSSLDPLLTFVRRGRRRRTRDSEETDNNETTRSTSHRKRQLYVVARVISMPRT